MSPEYELPQITDPESQLSAELVDIGQRVIVKRSDGTIESDWTVSGQWEKVDPNTGEDAPVTMVEKVVDGKHLSKEILTSDLIKLQQEQRKDVNGEVPVGAEVGGIETKYDRFFGDESDEEEEFSVEDAAVRLAESEDDRLTRERREADARAAVNDAYLMAKSMKND